MKLDPYRTMNTWLFMTAIMTLMVVAIFLTLVAVNLWVMAPSCAEFGARYGYQTDYGWRVGCNVQIDGAWVPKEQLIRILEGR